jgi:hypothetical protein
MGLGGLAPSDGLKGFSAFELHICRTTVAQEVAPARRKSCLIASGKYPLRELYTHSFDLADVGLAIRTVAGDAVAGSIHVSVLPWSEH